jgi:hypothetical protein
MYDTCGKIVIIIIPDGLKVREVTKLYNFQVIFYLDIYTYLRFFRYLDLIFPLY